MQKKTIAVVTGSNGFIGKHLVKYLLDRNFTVRCIDFKHVQKYPSVEYFELDLQDYNKLLTSKAIENAEYIFHLAGVTKRTTLDDFIGGNYITTRNLLKAIKETNVSLKRFLFLSSQAAAGPAKALNKPIKETDSPSPVEAYGRSKLDSEIMLARQSAIPFTIIRASCVYGPDDVDFQNVFKQANYHLAIYADNKSKYASVIYVEDLVRGIYQAALGAITERKVYFLTDERIVNWNDIYKTIAKSVNKKVLKINIPYSMISIAAHLGNLYSKVTGKHSLLNTHKIKLARADYWLCTSEAANRDFGFKTQYSLEAGIHKTWIHIRESSNSKTNSIIR